MKLTSAHQQPFRPTTPVEHRLCVQVEAASGETVLQVWHRDSYPFEDLHGERVPLGADYEIRTGRLHAGLFASGSVFLGYVRDDGVEIEFEGSWTA